jgi:hypothetical protein
MCGWFCTTMTKDFKMKFFDSHRFQDFKKLNIIRVVGSSLGFRI